MPDARHRFWESIDIVVLDLDDSDPDYIRFVADVRDSYPQLSILSIVHPAAFEMVAALATRGVERFVTNTLSAECLVRAIASVTDDRRCASHDPSPMADYEEFDHTIRAHSAVVALSDKEVDVLRMVADGLRNREIAEKLFLSEPTVKRHTQQVYRKIGARDRAHAAALANRLGLI